MLRSMTAFSRIKKNFQDVEITVEMQSLNKRHLEIQLKLSPELASFDAEIRKIISEHIVRGGLLVTVQALFLKNHPATVTFNSSLAKKIIDEISHFAKDLGYENLPFQELFSILVKEKGILQINTELENSDYYKRLIEESLLACLESLIKMKEREGKLLLGEFQERCKTLKKIIQEIEKKAEGATKKLRKKLIELLQELSLTQEEADERLVKEIAIFSEKVDIAEEISRFQHHLAHFGEILTKEKDKESNGKTLEFILQELMRETNTIGSKAQDAEIGSLVISAKSEIEKLREQVQNVE